MAAKGDVMAEAGTTPREVRSRRAALSPELIAILAVGVTLAGVMLTMMVVIADSFARELGAVRGELQVAREEVRVIREEVRVIREEVRVIRDGQIDLRERMARVESKVDVLTGDWPPNRGSGTAG